MVEETRSVTDLLLVIPTHLSTIPDVGDLYADDLLNILMQRFQNVNEDIFEDLNNLKTHVYSTLNNLENVLVGNHNNDTSSSVGRPRLTLSMENIMFLYNLYKNWKIVAFVLGMSERTVRRRRLEFGLNISGR